MDWANITPRPYIYKGQKDIGEAIYHKYFSLKLSAVGAFRHVTLKVTRQNVPTALNSLRPSIAYMRR